MNLNPSVFIISVFSKNGVYFGFKQAEQIWQNHTSLFNFDVLDHYYYGRNG